MVVASGDIGHSDEVGMELWLKGSLPWGLRWNASYALAGITDHFHRGLPNLDFTTFARSTPRNTFIAGLGYSKDKWELDTSARWQSHYDEPPDLQGPSLPSEPINGFLTIDARVGYNITKYLNLAVSGDQFLRARIPETQGLEVERRVIVSLTAHL